MEILGKLLKYVGFITIIAFIWVFIAGITVDVDMSKVCGANGCSGEDSITIAAKLARLDLVTFALTFAGIGLGFLVIYSVVNTREDAKKVAKNVAEKYLEERIEIEREFFLPAIVRQEVEDILGEEQGSYNLDDVNFDDLEEESPNGQ